MHLPLQGLDLAVQRFDLIGTGQHPGALSTGTTAHGAARVHHLAVQGHNAKAVVVLLGHTDGRVQVLHNHRATQQVRDDLAVPTVAVYQLRRQRHIAKAVLQTPLL